jgi:hypothetical protein
VQYEVSDFAGAKEFFEGPGAQEWADIASVLKGTTLQLQPSDQAGLNHRPIFDPKATNKELTERAAALGWNKIPVPDGLTEFGLDWDAGKRTTLAEWQFSNYPFLWNNVIRTQGVFVSGIPLAGMSGVESLIVVTKCGLFPASNSTLYYEQGLAQLQAAMSFSSFTVPIRLVGLTIPGGASEIQAMWNSYANARYDRAPSSQEIRTFHVAWRGKPAKHGNYAASFSLE